MNALRHMKTTMRSSAGFTLMEVIVAVGILSLVITAFGSGVLQVVSVQQFWRDDVVATRELRRAGTWFAGDALNAVTTSLADGAAPSSTVTLNWTSGGSAVTSAYAISGGNLVRTFGGQQLAVARDVSSVAFSLSGKLLTFTLTVNAGETKTDGRTLQTYLRKMQ